MFAYQPITVCICQTSGRLGTEMRQQSQQEKDLGYMSFPFEMKKVSHEYGAVSTASLQSPKV